MFRRLIIRHGLSVTARRLISRYGIRNYYSRGQIEKCTSSFHLKGITRFTAELFLNVRDADDEDAFFHRKQSLYRYLNRDIMDSEIERNEFWKVIYIKGISDISGAHNKIGVSSGIVN